MADTSNFVLKAYKTEANARADANPLAVDNTSQADGSTVDNPSQASGYGFWAFQRYWYRIIANEPVSEFHIDWDDGEDNSPKKANVSIIKNDKPSFVGIVSHIYTQSKSFYPLIRVKSIEGFLSKWYTPYSIANRFDGLDDDIKTDGNDKGQNSFSVVSVERNDNATAYARIPIFKPANISPIGVLKADRKKVFASMDNAWLGNNSRVLKGDSADEMPYSHIVHAVCSNPSRTGAEAKVTYQEGRIGGVSAITEVTTTDDQEDGSYVPPSGAPSIRGFNANDLDQKVIYITSMDETYGCYFVWNQTLPTTATSNSTPPDFSGDGEPYASAVHVPIEILAADSTGDNNYVSSENLADRLAETLNDITEVPGHYHGRKEFTAVSSNLTLPNEKFRVVVHNLTDAWDDSAPQGNSFDATTPYREKAPASNLYSSDDGLTVSTAGSPPMTNYGKYFTFSSPQLHATEPVNYYVWLSQNAAPEKTYIDITGNSFTGGGDEKEAVFSTADDGLMTHSSLTKGYGNYFTFTAQGASSDTDYYVWFKQAAVNEVMKITVTGNSFTGVNERTRILDTDPNDGLATWYPNTELGKTVSNYFQFKYIGKDYVIYFSQDGITEKCEFTFTFSDEEELEDAYIILWTPSDTPADGTTGNSDEDIFVVYFETDAGGTALVPAWPDTIDFLKKVTLAGGATTADAATALAAALNSASGWTGPGSVGGATPFSADASAARVTVEMTDTGPCEDAQDKFNSGEGKVDRITTTTTVQGKDDAIDPGLGYHTFANPNTRYKISYVDGDSDDDIAGKIFDLFDSGAASSNEYLDGITATIGTGGTANEVTLTAVGAMSPIDNLTGGGSFGTSHDGLASGSTPVDVDLSTGFTFLNDPHGKQAATDPATEAITQLSGRTGIEVPYVDGESREAIALRLYNILNLHSGDFSASEAPGGHLIGIENDNGGAVTHAADGTTSSSEDGLNLSTGFDFGSVGNTPGLIHGKNKGLDPAGPHNDLLDGYTGIEVAYSDGQTPDQIATAIYDKLDSIKSPGGGQPDLWSIIKPATADGSHSPSYNPMPAASFELTMVQGGPTDDARDGRATGSPSDYDLRTGFDIDVTTDATGRYTITTTHINKGVIPVAFFDAPGVAGQNSNGCQRNNTYLFERTTSESSPPTYYAPRALTPGVDPSDGSIKQKTLICGAAFTAGARLSNVGKILKMELVNNLENTDSYGGSTGTSTLVPGERIYLQSTLSSDVAAVDAGNYLPNSAARVTNLNLSGTICSVSLGNPIVEENSIGSKLSVDATESKVRCSNKSISFFYIDDNKLISGDIVGNTSSHQAADTNNVTDKLVGGADFKSTTGTKDLWYTFDWWREHQDANYRYYSYKRLIRTQIEDSHVTTVADDSFNLSPIVHWDSSTYLTIGSAAALSDGQPLEISKWNYGVFLFTNQAKIRTPDWTDLSANNREDRIPIFCSNAAMSNTLGNSSVFDTSSDVAHYAPDNRYVARLAADSDTVGPRNALFMARKEKFDRIFVRVSHDRYNAAGQVLSALVSDITVGTTSGWPKIRMQVLYPAKKTRNSSTIIWKPLPIVDRTMLKGKDDSSLYKSGDIIFIPPADWEKTSHNINIEYPYEDNFFDDGSGTDGIDDRWNKDSYALIFLITHIASTGGLGGEELGKNVFNIMSMYPYNNSHSQLIEVVDPTHVSLNKFGIAQSVAFVRKGKYQEIKDRSGISLMRRVGAEGGKFKLGGIDLKGDPETMRAKFNEFQKDSVPVYYDVIHKDDSITRLFGIMTDMSEDHPTADLIPKFACSLTVTHILEIDSNGNITGKGYKPLGGDTIDAEQYLSTS